MSDIEAEIASVARALVDRHPGLDPLTLGFKGLAKRIRELDLTLAPRAIEDPDWLEAVQRTWHELFEAQGGVRA
jgi:FeS assembly protein IscX